MTKREEYNLNFIKAVDPIDKGIMFICTSKTSSTYNTYSSLMFLDHLSKGEVELLIQSINDYQNDLPFDPAFLEQQGLEATDIVFEKPFFTIDGLLTIHMDDLKQLLEEWLVFITN